MKPRLITLLLLPALMSLPEFTQAQSRLPAGSNGIWSVSHSNTYYNAGYVGIGTSTPQAPLDIVGDWNEEQGGLQLRGIKPTLRFTGDAITGNQSWLIHMGGEGPGNLVFFRKNAAGTSSSTLTLAASGNVGIGTPAPVSKLEITGDDALRLAGYQPFLTFVDRNAGSTRSRIQGVNGRLVLQPETFVNGGNLETATVLETSGNLSVKSLTIRNGVDLSEVFEITGGDIPKGSVLVIDEQHPGKLKLSRGAYDVQVAGIVTGAKDLEPGINLREQGAAGVGQSIALSGRVYALADAANGAIKPGDLLTTSDTPGHAMKASD